VSRSSGITGIEHIAVVTRRIEEAEAHYGDLFNAVVAFRTALYEGDWVAIEAQHDWEAIRRARLKIQMSFLRAGALTIAVTAETADKDGPLGHACLACTDAGYRRIRDRVRALRLREHREPLGTFRFVDAFGVRWEILRPGDEPHRPPRRLDLRSGRVT
jgi:catechol 2,3-dioxygenase-like lactoylglutathione lyase family enzyme